MELHSQSSGNFRSRSQPTPHAPAGAIPAIQVSADRGCHSSDGRGGKNCGPLPTRSQRSPAKGESAHLITQDTRLVMVFDPALPADAKRRLIRKINGFWDDASWGTGCGGLTLGLLYLIASFILHFAAGLDWWWLCATAAPPAAGFAAAARAFSASKLEQRDRARFVAPSDLDKSGCALLNRAQSAIKAVLSSEVYADGLLGQGVGEAVLRRHEWEIALALRDIAGLRGQLSLSTATGVPGPMTAAVLGSHQRALALAQDATVSRIKALECYAAQVHAADAAKRDWERALEISGLNDMYLDLVARTAGDEYAVTEITGLTRQAADAARVFRDSLDQASLAGAALTFPDGG